ncbi:hypothetical protein F511_04015, partial [Dorcoceras hygrometricum]
KWRNLSMDDKLWSSLFMERWGIDRATFYEPIDSKSWKDVYIVQDRCDRIGLGLKIIREGNDYLLVHQGEIQRHLGSRRKGSRELESLYLEDGYVEREEEPCSSILDSILFFIGDLESASVGLKRSRLM